MIYLIDIEAIDMRYSTQWREWIPKYFSDGETVTISGTDYCGLSDGGFFDFTSTNIYKSEQVIKLGNLIKNGRIKDGDVFCFYDVWHPGVINLRYMLDLAGIDAKIYGLLHAGSYDPTDILGIHELGRWADGFEESMVKACDAIFVASNYHRDMFIKARNMDEDKIIVAGWPYDFTFMDSIPDTEKEDIIVFPHRISPDKQPWLFDELEEYLPNFEFVKTIDLQLPKKEYHELLKKSKIIFSAALHENLGLATMEATYSGCIPVLPNRCSYKEIYHKDLLYPSAANSKEIAAHILNIMDNYELYKKKADTCIDAIKNKYFNFEKIKKIIK